MQQSAPPPIGALIALACMIVGIVQSKRKGRTVLYLIAAIVGTIIIGLGISTGVAVQNPALGRQIGAATVDVSLFAGALAALVHARITRKTADHLSKGAD